MRELGRSQTGGFKKRKARARIETRPGWEVAAFASHGPTSATNGSGHSQHPYTCACVRTCILYLYCSYRAAVLLCCLCATHGIHPNDNPQPVISNLYLWISCSPEY
jgi:hypothetical protein